MRQHPMRRLFEFGGYAAAVILIAFGVVALVPGINWYRAVGDELKVTSNMREPSDLGR